MNESVSVFICGVQKGGTSTLDAYFREHPGLAAPGRKEIHFFDDETIDWSAPDYGQLASWFSGGGLQYDATPIYSFWEPSLRRLHEYNPGAKLVFLFRDPFERAWSHWCMEHARGNERLPFPEALRQGRRRLDPAQPLTRQQRLFSYVERGFYSGQVRRALGLFPRANLLFLRSNDLFEDHPATLARIADFLGLSPFPDMAPKWELPRPQFDYPSTPSVADRELLARELRDELGEFPALTGLNIDDWPTAQLAQSLDRSAP